MSHATMTIITEDSGIYAYHHLATFYGEHLYVDTYDGYRPFLEWLAEGQMDLMTPDFEDAHTAEGIFHPDNPEWMENVEFVRWSYPLAVKIDGDFWHLESEDGALIAVNPDAMWNDEIEAWVL